MSLRIIQEHETITEFPDKLVLLDMGEPDLYAIHRDPTFLIGKVPHEYVCFDARRGEIVKIDEDALNRLKEIAR